MFLKIDNPLVTVDWLNTNLDNKDLIILDATISKVTDNNTSISDKNIKIKRARFFDIKKEFSDSNSSFPNTILSSKKFEEKARKLGVNKQSCIVVYDNIGIYSSPRVWWMFKIMGFNNIGVLNGGFPEWNSKNFPTEKSIKKKNETGNFKAIYNPKNIKFINDVILAIKNKKFLITDARSKERYYATQPEPRIGLKGGHIPNSKNLPYNSVIEKGKMKSNKKLREIFKDINPTNKEFIFSCGSGITASILALAADIDGHSKYSVYDGSWTEWASTENIPIAL